MKLPKTLLLISLSGAISLAVARAAGPASPSIGDWAPPEERSATPKPAEWEAAAPLTLLRPNRHCTARALREWIQVSCRHPSDWGNFMGVRVVGGSEEGVHMTDFKAKAAVADRDAEGVNVMFPVRKGDRRLIAIDEALSVGFKSYTIEEDTLFMISALWLPGDRGPTIVVH